jgi:hypothetical protein
MEAVADAYGEVIHLWLFEIKLSTARS